MPPLRAQGGWAAVARDPAFVEADLIAYLVAFRLAQVATLLQPGHPAIPTHDMDRGCEHTWACACMPK